MTAIENVAPSSLPKAMEAGATDTVVDVEAGVTVINNGVVTVEEEKLVSPA